MFTLGYVEITEVMSIHPPTFSVFWQLRTHWLKHFFAPPFSNSTLEYKLRLLSFWSSQFFNAVQLCTSVLPTKKPISDSASIFQTVNGASCERSQRIPRHLHTIHYKSYAAAPPVIMTGLNCLKFNPAHFIHPHNRAQQQTHSCRINYRSHCDEWMPYNLYGNWQAYDKNVTSFIQNKKNNKIDLLKHVTLQYSWCTTKTGKSLCI